jgi:hypothetical protein
LPRRIDTSLLIRLAVARSRAPSPSKSPAMTDGDDRRREFSDREAALMLEGSVAVAQQDRHVITEDVGGNQVEGAVPIDIRGDDRRGAVAGGVEARLLTEAAVAARLGRNPGARFGDNHRCGELEGLLHFHARTPSTATARSNSVGPPTPGRLPAVDSKRLQLTSSRRLPTRSGPTTPLFA